MRINIIVKLFASSWYISLLTVMEVLSAEELSNF